MSPLLICWIAGLSLGGLWFILRSEIEIREQWAKALDDSSEQLSPVWYTLQKMLPFPAIVLIFVGLCGVVF